ncbi:melanocyte protein PMEL isoform X4 [Rana temporaria]|uniref:melanocyte protein PMEL isoform X4 n=1 Tax=Rana temporaria TaxID=8407 RepID=UPI001AAD7080|nr:melanocyte protein PMEL isoform X4 [Rana temporaria]
MTEQGMMRGVWSLAVLWLLCAGIEAQNGSRSRVQQSNSEVQSNKRPPFRSWNSRMYPIWKGSESQKRDCWKGGQVAFSVQNDAPTLTGAKATFFIKINFPQNQTVLPDGQVVWNQNRTDNGTWAPVYSDEGTEGSECKFPDGSPFPRDSEKRRSKFVYVWQAWGKYWQVVDGPSSNLTIDTDGIPLGSYTMEVVVYHYRGRQKFIPIGSTSSQFVITDQIPVSVSISQVLDLDQEDQRFIQNRAVSFSLAVHDPSNYLQAADISFSWDFGDQSGTFITRNTAVTHTYITPGVFNAKVVVQAAIPITPCGGTVAVLTTAQVVGSTAQPPEPSTRAAAITTAGGQTVAPSTAAVPGNSTLLDTEANALITVASLNEEVNVEPEEDPAIATAVPENEQALPADESEVVAATAIVPTDTAANQDVVAVTQPEAVGTEATQDVVAVTQPEAVGTEATQDVVAVTQPESVGTEATQDVVAVAQPEAVGTEATQDVIPSDESVLTEDVTSDNALDQLEVNATPVAEGTDAAPATEASQDVASAVPTQAVANEVVANEVVTVTEANGEVLLLAKRQAPEGPIVGCLLYRYGTFAADLDIVSGIESIQIVQVEPIVSAGLENTVEFTVTCQGSVPREVCTVISGPDCDNPQQTVCSPVEPSSDCQVVLRQVFNETGVFCVNVSLADDVSLAVASTQVSVSAGVASSVNGVAVTVGVLLAALAIATVAYTYRHVKSYTPIRSSHATGNWFPDRPSLWLFIQNALGRSASGENSPLLNGRVV